MSAGKLRVLAIGPQPAWPVTDGGKEGIFNALVSLSRKCNIVYAFPAFGNSKNVAMAYQKKGIQCLPLKYHVNESLISILWSCLRLKSFKFEKYSAKDAKKILCSKVKFYSIDCILCFSAHTFALGQAVVKQLKKNVPIILRSSNVEHNLVRSYRERLGFIKKYLLLPIECITKWHELDIWDKADAITFLTHSDYNYAQSCTHSTKMFMVPDGISFPRIKKCRYPGQNAFLLVLFNPAPLQNKINIRIFIQDYWLKISSNPLLKNTELKVTGVTTNELAILLDLPVSQLTINRIAGIGYVNKLSVIFEKSLGVVSPSFVGSGVRKKILESMANMVPCIATPLDISSCKFFKEGRNILPMKNPSDLLKSLSLLIDNKNKWLSISLNGRKIIKKNCCWNKSAHKTFDIMKRAVANKIS